MSLSAASQPPYSQILRVIGQFLEQAKPTAFDLEILNQEVILRLRLLGNVTEERPKSIFSIFSAASSRPKSQESTSERRFSFVEIQELDQEGQKKRVSRDGEADFYVLSQTLRTVGTYIEHRNQRLLSLNWDGARLVLQLEGTDGRTKTEEHPVSSFHDYFLRMYLKRKKRSSVSIP